LSEKHGCILSAREKENKNLLGEFSWIAVRFSGSLKKRRKQNQLFEKYSKREIDD
jgi:hypothetical protein